MADFREYAEAVRGYDTAVAEAIYQFADEMDRLRAENAEKDRLLVAMRNKLGDIRLYAPAGSKPWELAAQTLALTPSDLSDCILAPREPTEAMIEAANKLSRHMLEHGVPRNYETELYRAMLRETG